MMPGPAHIGDVLLREFFVKRENIKKTSFPPKSSPIYKCKFVYYLKTHLKMCRLYLGMDPTVPRKSFISLVPGAKPDWLVYES